MTLSAALTERDRDARRRADGGATVLLLFLALERRRPGGRLTLRQAVERERKSRDVSPCFVDVNVTVLRVQAGEHDRGHLRGDPSHADGTYGVRGQAISQGGASETATAADEEHDGGAQISGKHEHREGGPAALPQDAVRYGRDIPQHAEAQRELNLIVNHLTVGVSAAAAMPMDLILMPIKSKDRESSYLSMLNLISFTLTFTSFTRTGQETR